MADKLIERAQRQVEAHNFDIRKHLLKYDDVMNRQREVIYEIRREVLDQSDLTERIGEMITDVARETAMNYTEGKHPEFWPFKEFQEAVTQGYGLKVEYEEDAFMQLTPETFADNLESVFVQTYKTKEERLGPTIMREAERFFMLNTLDTLWMSHLWAMDHLRDSVRFSGYAQRDPLIEYKREALELFRGLLWKINEETTRKLFRFELAEPSESKFERKGKDRKMTQRKDQAASPAAMARRRGQQPHTDDRKPQPVRRSAAKIGPNDPCPCGSGKKYKKCCRDKEKPV